MDIEEFNKTVRDYREKNPHIRRGQASFNIAWKLFDGLAHRVIGIEGLDPFYKDENLPAFINFLVKEGFVK